VSIPTLLKMGLSSSYQPCPSKRGNPRSVGGAVLVEWMLPGGHGSADPGLGM